MCVPNGVGRESHTQDIDDNMKRELMRIFSDNGKKEETVDKQGIKKKEKTRTAQTKECFMCGEEGNCEKNGIQKKVFLL